jgi:hypothetical protein
MRRKLLHALVAFTAFVVVWLVASPARAMAPLCDPRGAVVFAPPPQFQDPETSLDLPADCTEDSPIETKNFAPGRAPQIEPWSSQEPAAATAPAVLDLVFTERLAVPDAESARPPSGVRTTVERPPRH